jgi:hypothetical protein
MTKLRELINYINKSTDQFKIGDVKDLIEPGEIKSGTLNNYIKQLTRMYYTKRLGEGWYIKIRNIPTDITAKELYDFAKLPEIIRSRKIKIKEFRKDAEKDL